MTWRFSLLVFFQYMFSCELNASPSTVLVVLHVQPFSYFAYLVRNGVLVSFSTTPHVSGTHLGDEVFHGLAQDPVYT